MTMKLIGGCLCGAVRYESPDTPQMVGHCYCQDCRKSSGTGHCTHVLISEVNFKLEGSPRFFAKPADSGHMIRQGFCPDCGSALYSTNDAAPGAIFLRASSLDTSEGIVPQLSVYASRAMDWDRPPDVIPAFAHMPPQLPIP
jgi:hypothetical protein